MLYIHNSKVLWVSLSSFSAANRLAFSQKNERTACTHRKSAFFLLHFLSILLLPYSLAISFQITFCVSFASQCFIFRHIFACMFVCIYVCMKEFCALYFGWFLCCVFSSNFTFFFALHHSVCFAYFILFLICCFSVRCSWDIGFFFLCSVALPWWNKKNFIYFAFTDFFILFFFLLDLFHFFANFFFDFYFFHSLAHSLSPSSYSVNLISCSFCAICHTRKCSMFTYKYSYKLLLYYYISRTHQKCE